ncbi:MAG: IS4 family transposase [Sporomusa sp.]
MRLGEMLTKKTQGKVSCDEFKNEARKKAIDFSRKRKMTFEELILFMLLSLKCSTASALRRFFKDIGKSIFMTQQSLSEARAKINVCAFVDLFKLTVETMTEHCMKKWHGYRVYAIDGSKIALPAEEKLREHFGTTSKGKTALTAQGSVLYDVLNDIIADALIKPLSTDERTLAKLHLDACKDIAPNDKKLIIFDRGYPSFELIEKLENNGFHYVMRVKSKFNNDIDGQITSDGYVWLKQDVKRIHVRVIKIKLDSGETETLITNIKDKRLGKNAFKKLYFMRWPVECKYDIVKNKLQLENFNTRTIEGIQQDFFAAMYLTNFAAAIAIDVQDDIEENRKEKDNKYRYKANINELIGS